MALMISFMLSSQAQVTAAKVRLNSVREIVKAFAQEREIVLRYCEDHEMKTASAIEAVRAQCDSLRASNATTHQQLLIAESRMRGEPASTPHFPAVTAAALQCARARVCVCVCADAEGELTQHRSQLTELRQSLTAVTRQREITLVDLENSKAQLAVASARVAELEDSLRVQRDAATQQRHEFELRERDILGKTNTDYASKELQLTAAKSELAIATQAKEARERELAQATVSQRVSRVSCQGVVMWAVTGPVCACACVRVCVCSCVCKRCLSRSSRCRRTSVRRRCSSRPWPPRKLHWSRSSSS